MDLESYATIFHETGKPFSDFEILKKYGMPLEYSRFAPSHIRGNGYTHEIGSDLAQLVQDRELREKLLGFQRSRRLVELNHLR